MTVIDDAAPPNGRPGRAPSHTTKPYKVEPSKTGMSELLAGVNANLFAAHGPDMRFGSGADKLIAAPLSRYDRLLREIRSIPGVEFTTHRDALAEPCPDNTVRVLVRHDLDVDLNAAMAQARIERSLGIKTSYYVLHTAPYYGTFERGRLLRNECAGPLYRELQDLGHEVGLHSDGLHVYQTHGMDGARAIETEIAWLRSLGIDVTGTLAHNSISAYGAANFAIFRGRPQGLLMDAADAPEIAEKDGKLAPLGVLDERALGLEYEGNDVFWQRDTPVFYGVAWSSDRWWWEPEKRTCVSREVPARNRDPGAFLPEDEFLDRLRTVRGPALAVLVVHPVYYGCRHAPDAGPGLRVSLSPAGINADIGWETWTPRSIVAIDTPDPDGGQHAQSINAADRHGMLHGVEDDTPAEIAFFGGTNTDAAPLGVTSHAVSIVNRRLRELETPAVVVKHAHPGMGFGRLAGWYEARRDNLTEGATVVVGVGADMMSTAHPAGWRRLTGFHPEHAPGAYLDLRDGEPVMKPAGPCPELHRSGRDQSPMPSLCDPSPAWHRPMKDRGVRDWLKLCLGAFLEKIAADGRHAALLIEECGENAGLWTPEHASSAHERFRERLDQILGDHRPRPAIIDPYERFLALNSFPTSHLPDGTWSELGHRVAADAILDTLADPAVRPGGKT